MSIQTPPRVVVADDSAMMRHIVSSSLSRAGVQIVGSAPTVDEALAACERERPDALMLDLSMPGLDGIGVLRALRQSGRSEMPVIVVSAFSPSQGARAVDALAEGAFDLVAKPAIGEGLDGFAADPRGQGQGGHGRAAPPDQRRPPACASRAGSARSSVSRSASLIATSTGGPKALAALMPQASAAARRRHADRPAHASGLHQVAGGTPGSGVGARDPRGRGRRVARSARRAAGARAAGTCASPPAVV